jgi:hypothetical protein
LVSRAAAEAWLAAANVSAAAITIVITFFIIPLLCQLPLWFPSPLHSLNDFIFAGPSPPR